MTTTLVRGIDADEPQPESQPSPAGHHPSRTSDTRVTTFTDLASPRELASDLPMTGAHEAVVERGRAEVVAVLDGLDDRLLVVVGPCSVHDTDAALEYAGRLAERARAHAGDLVVVMRTYFEKPRTTVGWKGLINDPHLDGTHDIATGLHSARRFLLDVTGLGLPCGTEFLEPISPQYTADLVSWGAIGARTSESQIHRQLVSGLSMPVGFKNGTDGGLQIALDACAAAAAPQSFLGIDTDGRAALVATVGNRDTHVILRGGKTGPNHTPPAVTAAGEAVAAAGLAPRLVVDASHGNSGKDHVRQAAVAGEIADQVAAGSPYLAGVMLESFLVAGAQRLDPGVTPPDDLVRGQSITDGCLGWDVTVDVLDRLAAAVRERRTA